MDVTTLVVTLLIGAVSGWIAGQIKDGFGFGLLGNIVLGIIGAFVGSWLFAVLNIHIATGIVGTIITSVCGALLVLVIIGLVKKA